MENPFDSRFYAGQLLSHERRKSLNLTARLPVGVRTFDVEMERIYRFYQKLPTDILRYVYLRKLLEESEPLFYHFVLRRLAEMVPILYTPTVGEACLSYSELPILPRGLYLSYERREEVEEAIKAWPFEPLIAVITDGESILGLGDLGVHGMAISVGKLILYTLLGGISPDSVLPIVLDVGTDRKELRENPLYGGSRMERLRGAPYFDFVDRVVLALKSRNPALVLQWEDFGKGNANVLLRRYREVLPSFNDDIEGTSVVVCAALINALREKKERWSEQRICIVGAGAAGGGIAAMILQALEKEGVERSRALDSIYLFNSQGLLSPINRGGEFVSLFVKEEADLARFFLSPPFDLATVMQKIRPTALIGVSGKKGLFSEELIRHWSLCVERPIIFPLSNPTMIAEATPQDLWEWTCGRALIATGSPFPPFAYQGAQITVVQANNALIFPSLGLSLLASGAPLVSRKMLYAAAEALAEEARKGDSFRLLPSIAEARNFAKRVAFSIAMQSDTSFTQEQVQERLAKLFWSPPSFDE